MTNHDYRLRTATTADLAQLYAFEQQIVAAERPYDQTMQPGHIHYYDLASLLADPQAEICVLEWQQQLVGSGFAHIRTAKAHLQHGQYLHLGFMYVHPAHRGNGLNQRLIQRLIDWGRQQGVNEVRLEVYAPNEAALSAYKKAGFRPHIMQMRLDDTSE